VSCAATCVVPPHLCAAALACVFARVNKCGNMCRYGVEVDVPSAPRSDAKSTISILPDLSNSRVVMIQVRSAGAAPPLPGQAQQGEQQGESSSQLLRSGKGLPAAKAQAVLSFPCLLQNNGKHKPDTPMCVATYGENVAMGMISAAVQDWTYHVVLDPGADAALACLLLVCYTGAECSSWGEGGEGGGDQPTACTTHQLEWIVILPLRLDGCHAYPLCRSH
jgi:hypothetical protein